MCKYFLLEKEQENMISPGVFMGASEKLKNWQTQPLFAYKKFYNNFITTGKPTARIKKQMLPSKIVPFRCFILMVFVLEKHWRRVWNCNLRGCTSSFIIFTRIEKFGLKQKCSAFTTLFDRFFFSNLWTKFKKFDWRGIYQSTLPIWSKNHIWSCKFM